MKICNKCLVSKPLTEFPSKGAVCKACVTARSKAWREANPERYRTQMQAHYEKNRERLNAANNRRRAETLEASRAREREYGRRNAEAKRKQAREWAKVNADKARARVKAWRAANPAWAAAQKAAYKARRRRGTPPWVRAADIAPFYAEAQRRSEETGVPHHVDHIVPLQGTIVSGLHVPWNLQVIPAAVNIAKHNRFLPALAEGETDNPAAVVLGYQQ